MEAKKMNVLACIVNYRTDDALCAYVRTLAEAWEGMAHPGGQLSILVVDNSGKTPEQAQVLEQRLGLLHRSIELSSSAGNLGYFGALPLAQEKAARMEFDCVVFSNADLVVALDFFTVLGSCRDIGAVLAPSILVAGRGGEMNQNPLGGTRMRREQLMFLRAVHGSSPVFACYRLLWRLRDWVRVLSGSRSSASAGAAQRRKIYSAHGSMFIFSDVRFFCSLRGFTPFLFGEEIYVAEEAMRAGVDIVFVPELHVRHSRHASMSSLPRASQRKYLLESLTFLLNRYHGNAQFKE
jgi:hypothetical protein